MTKQNLSDEELMELKKEMLTDPALLKREEVKATILTWIMGLGLSTGLGLITYFLDL